MASMIRTVHLPGRHALDCYDSARIDGAAILLLHGYTDSRLSWAPVIAALPPRFRVVAPSQRGHGRSNRPETGYRMADFAADAVDLLDALGIARAVVVGHSMGAAVAERLAARHPERVSALVLAGAFGTFRDNREIAALDDLVAGLADPIDAGFVRAFQEGTLAQPVPASFLDSVVAESLRVPAQVWRAALSGMIAADPVAERRRIAAPTLVVHGARDALVPAGDADAITTAVADARLRIYAEAGHALHWEEPARFAAELAAFAERVTPGRSRAA